MQDSRNAGCGDIVDDFAVGVKRVEVHDRGREFSAVRLKSGKRGVAGDAAPAVSSSVASEAADALLSMGFTSAEADLALKGAPEDGTESTLLQYALKKLGA